MLAAFLTENFIATVQNANVVIPCSTCQKKFTRSIKSSPYKHTGYHISLDSKEIIFNVVRFVTIS
ncbi:hypothetical protein EATG_00348 [Escherichia coli H605]|uniref:Uncharacterized protein n=1 Tax=Escherichia coli H605 TaxID=656410 RepID=A0AAJ3P001_ECOLX|nr:hypothetical protein EATG_00348 [Escherichia coli H605]